MNLFPEHIILEGNTVSIKQILKKSTQTDWENDFILFLNDWYAPKKYIEVQTSGSTGKPKTIRLQKDFVAASANRTINYFGLKKSDKILHCLPSKFIAGKLMIVRALLGELDLHLTAPSTDFSILESERFQFAAMVPNQVEKLFKLKSWDSNLAQLLIGGAAISSSLEDKLHSVKTACYSSYGMTETATHIALSKINGEEADSFYHCLENISVGISNKNCLQINIPELSEKVLETTDLAELKDEKTFKILGRSDYVIISGGNKYVPEQLEKKLEPFIKVPFLISSKPHVELGQQIVLIIEGVKNPKWFEEINQTCQNNLEKFERPRKIIFKTKLPRNENGKIIRRIFL